MPITHATPTAIPDDPAFDVGSDEWNEDHDGSLTQAVSHDSPDTDSGTTALHHTLGTGANQAAAGDHSTHADLVVSGGVKFSGIHTSTVNADQNNFAPTGIHTDFSTIRFNSFSANRTVTGIDAGTDGEVLFLMNNTSFSLLLPNESGSSSTANRLRCPAGGTVTVRASGGVMLIYMAGRWAAVAI